MSEFFPQNPLAFMKIRSKSARPVSSTRSTSAVSASSSTRSRSLRSSSSPPDWEVLPRKETLPAVSGGSSPRVSRLSSRRWKPKEPAMKTRSSRLAGTPRSSRRKSISGRVPDGQYCFDQT